MTRNRWFPLFCLVSKAMDIEPTLNGLLSGKKLVHVEWHDSHGGDSITFHMEDGTAVRIVSADNKRRESKLHLEVGQFTPL